ncbi:MAG: N-acetylmuramoyl-L-alanine amidase [Meiothermus sp.]|nr:N-acetylmuramoyl-L-alanine amidase [Meiothermus sp.]
MRLIAFVAVLLAAALAFPRIGLHEGYTRLVFDLEAQTRYATSAEGNVFTIRLTGQRVQAREASLESPHVASYQVVPNAGGAVVVVNLRQGTEVKTSLLGGAGSAGRRLVVDVKAKATAQTPGDRQNPGPAQNAATAQPAARPQVQKTVVLDAGHGGPDSGAVGFVVEKEVALDLVLRLKPLLEAQGVRVVLTRDRDTALAPDKRGDLGARANMANNQRNVFVSVHVNSALALAQGIEVYYFGDLMDNSLLAQVIRENGGGSLGQSLTRESQTVAQRFISDLIAQSNLRFSRQLAHTVQSTLVAATGAVDRGVRQAPFYVIRRAQIPAILVEVGFANHPVEGRRLATEAYRQTLARAMAAGIMKFLGNGPG